MSPSLSCFRSNTRARADIVQHTHLAARCWGFADGAPMIDEQMREDGPVFTGNQLQQILFDLHCVRMRGQAKSVREPRYVCVDNNAFRFPKGVAEKHVRGFATYTRQMNESVHVIRHLAAMTLDERIRHAQQALRLVAVE